MLDAEARALFAAVKAAFPWPATGQATVDLYTAQLARWKSVPAAKRAVEEIIRTEERFPSVARLNDEYLFWRKREQEETARTRGLPEPSGPRELPPDVKAFLRSFTFRGIDDEAERAENLLEPLPTVPAGRCDQCSHDSENSERIQYGTFALCRPCALSRVRVAITTGVAA